MSVKYIFTLKRAEAVINDTSLGGGSSKAIQFAASMMAALYGPESPQMRQFRDGCAAIAKTATNPHNMDAHLCKHAIGTIRNTIAELKAGLIVRLRVVVAGEIFGGVDSDRKRYYG